MDFNCSRYELSYRDVHNILALLKEYYGKEPAAFDEEDAKLVLDLQIALDHYNAVMAYTE